jgi:8-oxo-dGTP pyrophosphatase MutT (NUDIX family)
MAKTFRQYGAVPFRRRKGTIEILLITSRRSKRWTLPKGWPKKSPRATAKAEAFEEAGVTGKVGRRPVGEVVYQKRKGARRVRCRLKIFPLAVKRRAKNWPERHQRSARWFDLRTAVKKCSNEDLRRLMRDFAPTL